ncbi:hypothetical protein Tco_1210644 [Tanacetum coccineum]
MGYEMNQHLKKCFRQASKSLDVVKSLMACKPKPRASICDFVLEMKGYVDRLESLNMVFDAELSINIILYGLLADYNQFVLSYKMNRKETSIMELHSLLQTAEQGIKKIDVPSTSAALVLNGYALETAVHILNLVPTKKVLKTPFETWKGKRPTSGNIKIWGCEVNVRKESQDKLEARSEKYLFVNYPEESFGYLFYKPKDNVVVTPVKPSDISLPIRKTSGRVSKPPQFYYGFHIEEDKISDSTLSELDEPANYKEAMASVEAAKWKEAMKSEI